ncbi:MAG: hypothetical protein U0S36_01485 [Candidatus Nanopelagicales bacterium]
MLVLVETAYGDVQPRRAGVLRRLLARLGRGRATRELAQGAAPDSSVTLALAAGELISGPHRHMLATQLLTLRDQSLSVARRGRAPLVAWVGVRRARAELSTLAASLDSGGPVAARGVALAEQLLTDGRGPLYYPDDADCLARAALEATRELDLAATLG